MCQNKKYLIFCTCTEMPSPNSSEAMIEAFKASEDPDEYNQYYYSWTLERIVRKTTEREKTMIIGSIIRPSRRLDEELNFRFVLEQLNGPAEFDFDYTPIEGDELQVELRYKYTQIRNRPRPSLPNAMRFVYRNKEWATGYIPYSEYHTKRLSEGKIKLEIETGKAEE